LKTQNAQTLLRKEMQPRRQPCAREYSSDPDRLFSAVVMSLTLGRLSADVFYFVLGTILEAFFLRPRGRGARHPALAGDSPGQIVRSYSMICIF
jgi:hypothetical protein